MKLFRIVDANLNRAREGLRVIEEIGRFYLNNEQLFLKLKTVRHLLKKSEELLGIEVTIYRDVESDVGKEPHANEIKTGGIKNLLKANAKRVQESLRVLEEFGNLNGECADLFKKARFETYELEKLLLLAIPKEIDYCLYLVTDDFYLNQENAFEIIEEALRAGVTVLQYRSKDKNTVAMLKEAAILKELCTKYNVPLFINDRIDIALAVDADGVHLGQKDMPYHIAKRLVGDKIIGLSASNTEEARAAILAGADYIGLGPIFPTQTKADAAKPCGIQTLSEIKKAFPAAKVVAIGGISLENAQNLVEAGADGLAVVSAILGAKKPQAVTEKLKKIYKEHKKGEC